MQDDGEGDKYQGVTSAKNGTNDDDWGRYRQDEQRCTIRTVTTTIERNPRTFSSAKLLNRVVFLKSW